MEFKVDLNHQELAAAVAGEVLKILKPLLEKGTGDDIIFDVKELSGYLHLDESWVYKAVAQKTIPFFKCGAYNRFRKSDIDDWIKKRSVKPYPNLINIGVHKIGNPKS